MLHNSLDKEKYEKELNSWKQAHSDVFYSLATSRNELVEAKLEIEKLRLENYNLQVEIDSLHSSYS